MCNNSFTSGPDYIFYSHLKEVLKDSKCCSNIVNIVNICINLSHWLIYFKKLSSIIILKLNKPLYNTSKAFCLIVLFNTLGKLIEKVISKRLQVYTIILNFINLS